jgi:hypothetical protein
MLNTASDALIKHINKKIQSWNSCIQYIKNVKSYFYFFNFHHQFNLVRVVPAPFQSQLREIEPWSSLTSASSAPFSIPFFLLLFQNRYTLNQNFTRCVLTRQEYFFFFKKTTRVEILKLSFFFLYIYTTPD